MAVANRSVSCGSRTNARTTRMPVICSRSTRLTSSMRACISRKLGTIRLTTKPTVRNSAGHDDGQDPAEAEVLAQRHDHAADHHDRRGDRDRAGHQHQHLHLLDVVGARG